MSASGSPERIRFLRETLAGLEQAGGGMAAAPVRKLAFGVEGFSFDRLLGGLFSGALYEAAPARMGDLAAATGFALALAARFAGSHDGPILWMSDEFSARENGAPYGPGIAAHGLDAARLIFVRAQSGPDLLWAMEEALRCGAPAAIVADLGSAARSFDLVAARRLTQAARISGAPAILLHPAGAFSRAQAQNGARMRFEICARPSVLSAQHSIRPVPGPAHFGVRLAKPGVEARGESGRMTGLDTELTRTIIWEHGHGFFRDALSLAVSAASGAGDRRDSA
jgi:protein ImuA